MLLHHDGRDYQDAARQAASWARDKLTAIIDNGAISGTDVIQRIEREVPTDVIAPASRMWFRRHNGGLNLTLDEGNWIKDDLGVHAHALGQAVDRSDKVLNRRAMKGMLAQGEWGRDLLAHALTQVYHHKKRDVRHLIRSVDGEVRGILSNKYRRLNSHNLLETFVKVTTGLGAKVIHAHHLDTKWGFKVALPILFEPIPNEVMMLGMVLESSDFGDGAVSMRCFLCRLWCTNLAIREEGYREVHLGKRLPDDVSLSERTYKLQTEATCSAMQDIVENSLSPEKVASEMEAIRQAAENSIDVKKALHSYQNRLSKDETGQIGEAFNGPDIVLLPQGNTSWRLSNAISLVAGQTEDQRRRIELQQIAGDAMDYGL